MIREKVLSFSGMCPASASCESCLSIVCWASTAKDRSLLSPSSATCYAFNMRGVGVLQGARNIVLTGNKITAADTVRELFYLL